MKTVLNRGSDYMIIVMHFVHLFVIFSQKNVRFNIASTPQTTNIHLVQAKPWPNLVGVFVLEPSWGGISKGQGS